MLGLMRSGVSGRKNTGCSSAFIWGGGTGESLGSGGVGMMCKKRKGGRGGAAVGKGLGIGGGGGWGRGGDSDGGDISVLDSHLSFSDSGGHQETAGDFSVCTSESGPRGTTECPFSPAGEVGWGYPEATGRV